MGQKKSGRDRRGPTRRRRRLARWGWWLWTVAALLVLVGAYYAWEATRPGTYVPSLGNAHITEAQAGFATYNSDPPTSGPHLPALARWGGHTAPIPRALQVHNLEDGGVLVQYHCPAGCPDLVERLRAIVESYPTQVILAPYPGMSHRIALTAWTRIDRFDDFDERRIRRFIRAYRGIDRHPRLR